MFVIKKNQVIITALVVMIGAAGYLSYLDKSTVPTEVAITQSGEAMVPDSDYLAQDIHTKTQETSAKEATNEEEIGEAVFVNNSSDTSYFVQAKLEREQSRAKQKDILTGMINNENVGQEKKSEAADEMLKIQQRIEKETAAEAMIEAKGFKEVYVRIDNDTVDVIVNKEELSETEIAQIEDIVKRKTGMKVEKIRISPIKKK